MTITTTTRLERNYNDDYELFASTSILESLCAYLNAFDGSRKTFNDIRPQFDNLFSTNLIHYMMDDDDTHNLISHNNDECDSNDGSGSSSTGGKINMAIHDKLMNKSTFVHIHTYLLQQRMVATLEDLYFPDDTHVKYTVHWANNARSFVSHVVALVSSQENKIIKVEACPETRGVFSNLKDHFFGDDTDGDDSTFGYCSETSENINIPNNHQGVGNALSSSLTRFMKWEVGYLTWKANNVNCQNILSFRH